MLVTYSFNHGSFNKEKIIDDCKRVRESYELLGLKLIDYYVIMEEIAYSVKNLEKDER